MQVARSFSSCISSSQHKLSLPSVLTGRSRSEVSPGEWENRRVCCGELHQAYNLFTLRSVPSAYGRAGIVRLLLSRRALKAMKVTLILLAIVSIVAISFIGGVDSIFTSKKAGNGAFRLSNLKRPTVAYSTAASISSDNAATEKVGGGTSSIATSTFNLAKSIIGAGVLAIPGGVAFFSDQPAALIPACSMATIFGLVAAYSFCSLGKICKDYDAKTFQEVCNLFYSLISLIPLIPQIDDFT